MNRKNIICKFIGKIKASISTIFLIGMVFPLLSSMAMAADASEGMPWVGPLQKITESISGPIAQAAGVIVIVIAGLGIAFGEGGSGVRRIFQVVMGLAIAFTAASIVAKLFGASAGVVF